MQNYLHKTCLIATLALLVSVSCSWSSEVPITANVKYEDGTWLGTLGCQFSNQTDCALSFHVQGRRIDVETHLNNENVFASCVSSETTIALTISNFSYDNIQDYTCLEDYTKESNHTWLYAFPEVISQGVETVGGLVSLTCSSFLGAPLFWVLPGADTDNDDVKILTFVNENNASTSASFKLQENDNYAEYKCCIVRKDSQDSEIPCDSYTFILDGSLQLISTYENYKDADNMQMECVFRSNPTPLVEKIVWKQCTSTHTCTDVYSYYINSTVDEDKHTLTSKLLIGDLGTYTSYSCSYNNTSYTFNVSREIQAPEVVAEDKIIFYSTDGYAITLGCTISANPAPQINWTKTSHNEFTNGSSSVSSVDNYKIEINQLSANQWQSTLVIFPYNFNEDTAVFTCTATNAHGQRSVQLTTNDGPHNLNVDMTANFNATYNPNSTDTIWGICNFQMFPYPSTYELNLLSAQYIDYNFTVAYDDQLSKTTAQLVFLAKTANYPITVECTAFDRFDRSIRLSDRFVVDASNFTTTIATTTTTPPKTK